MKSEWMRAFDNAVIRFTRDRTKIRSFEQLESRLSEVALATFQVAPTRFSGFAVHFNDIEQDAEFMDPHYEPTTGKVHISDADAVNINTLLHRSASLAVPGSNGANAHPNEKEGEALMMVLHEMVHATIAPDLLKEWKVDEVWKHGGHGGGTFREGFTQLIAEEKFPAFCSVLGIDPSLVPPVKELTSGYVPAVQVARGMLQEIDRMRGGDGTRIHDLIDTMVQYNAYPEGIMANLERVLPESLASHAREQFWKAGAVASLVAPFNMADEAYYAKWNERDRNGQLQQAGRDTIRDVTRELGTSLALKERTGSRTPAHVARQMHGERAGEGHGGLA